MRPRAQHGSRRLIASIAVPVLIALLIVLGFLWPQAFLRGYLSAFLLCIQIPLGAAAVLMLHQLVGGEWGHAVTRPLAAALWTAPALLVFFVPVALGLGQIFPWVDAHPQESAAWFRNGYLSTAFFLVRSATYLLVWAIGAWWIVSVLQKTDGMRGRPAAGPLASVGLLVYFLTVSFAAVDWVASLQEHWFSSVIGLYIIVGNGVAALAFAIVVALGRRGAETLPARGTLNDMATLLLAFIVLHAYLAFVQTFIIWNANLPHRIAWYVPRMRGGWGVVSVVLILSHFLLPMFALLQRAVKQRRRPLLAVATLVLAARVLEAPWLVLPSRPQEPVLSVVFTCLLIVTVIGLWLLLFGWSWKRIAPTLETRKEAAQ